MRVVGCCLEFIDNCLLIGVVVTVVVSVPGVVVVVSVPRVSPVAVLSVLVTGAIIGVIFAAKV